MPPSQLAPKDPRAVFRGKMSALARSIKVEKDGGTPVKKEPQSPPCPPIKVGAFPEITNGAFATVNNTTGMKKFYQSSHIPAGELQGMKRKLISADEFLLEATKARKKLKEDVFNSVLSKEEISALDLDANFKLFPELVNRDHDLRKRPLKEVERASTDGRFIKRDKLMSGETTNLTSLQAITSIPSRSEIAEQLTDKSKWFRDIEKAAAKQAEAYEGAAKEVTNSMTNDDKNRDESRPVIPTSGLEVFLSEDIPRLRQFTREEWRSRQNALLSHVHAIAENYRQELSSFAIYVNKSLKTLDKTSTSAATLLWHLSQHEVKETDLQAWSITEASEDSHRCECDVCKGRADAEEFSPIGLLRKDFERNKQEAAEAKAYLSTKPEWGDAIAAQPTEEGTACDKVEVLQAKYENWFSERTRTIESNHVTSLKDMAEKRSQIEWEMDARLYELESYETEIKRIENTPFRNHSLHHTSRLLEAIEQCRREISEDQKIRDADLDVEEFVEIYSIPAEKREDWLLERCRRDKASLGEKMKVILGEVRKELQSPMKSHSVDRKPPEEFKMLSSPLLESKGFSPSLGLRSTEE
ncbi:hypothetical protein FQN54_006134 [Arachnomyces sp. PD_36]|nr:hypothetical protein FQN54_006134 [Arachnomyces sp. PD_36]